MPEDYYGADEPGAAKATVATDKPEKPNQDDEADEETFLVPKSALAGKEPEPGETCEFEAVHDYGDEIEFKYRKHVESKKSMGDADTAMDKMASENMAEET